MPRQKYRLAETDAHVDTHCVIAEQGRGAGDQDEGRKGASHEKQSARDGGKEPRDQAKKPGHSEAKGGSQKQQHTETILLYGVFIPGILSLRDPFRHSAGNGVGVVTHDD